MGSSAVVDVLVIVWWTYIYQLFLPIAGIWLIGLCWVAQRERVNQTLFLALAVGLLVYCRLPVLLFNQELNPDESQVIASAITLQIDPVHWRLTDGATSGPLNAYALALPGWLGPSINYMVARLVGLCLLIGTLLSFFSTVKQWLGTSVARLALLPVVTLLSFTQFNDYVHFSSEHVPLFLLSMTWWLLARFRQKPSAGGLYAIGLVAGMVPFAKLQAVPLALVTVVMAVTLSRKSRPAGATGPFWVIGMLLSTAMFVVFLPGREFQHYMLLLLFPLGFWCALWISILPGNPRTANVVSWGAALMALLIVGLRTPINQFSGGKEVGPSTSAVGTTVTKYTRSGDCLAVWGWVAKYYVDTQLPQAVQDGNTIRCIFGSQNSLHRYQNRLLTAIRLKRPAVFIDVTGKPLPWFRDAPLFGHDKVMPALRQFIDEHYRFVGVVDEVRIYVRKDRLFDTQPIS